jgi:hypothetical protein
MINDLAIIFPLKILIRKKEYRQCFMIIIVQKKAFVNLPQMSFYADDDTKVKEKFNQIPFLHDLSGIMINY